MWGRGIVGKGETEKINAKEKHRPNLVCHHGDRWHDNCTLTWVRGGALSMCYIDRTLVPKILVF